jgi:hypothetical protein
MGYLPINRDLISLIDFSYQKQELLHTKERVSKREKEREENYFS